MGATIVISLNFTPTAPRGSSFGTPPYWPHCPARRGPPIPWKCCGAAAARWWQAVDPWVWSLAWQKHGWNMLKPNDQRSLGFPQVFGYLQLAPPKKLLNKQIQSIHMLIHWFPIEHRSWCRWYFGLFAFGHRHFLRGICGGADRLLRRLSGRSESGLNAPKKPQILANLGSQYIYIYMIYVYIIISHYPIILAVPNYFTHTRLAGWSNKFASEVMLLKFSFLWGLVSAGTWTTHDHWRWRQLLNEAWLFTCEASRFRADAGATGAGGRVGFLVHLVPLGWAVVGESPVETLLFGKLT